MRKFRISWTEVHEAEVEARDEDAAVDAAYVVDRDVTICGAPELKQVEDLGGYCDEHALSFEEDCPLCMKNSNLESAEERN